MTAPVHFDIAALRHQMRAQFDRHLAEVLAMCRTDDDRRLVEAQKRLSLVLIEGSCISAQLVNDGFPPTVIARAAGSNIASLTASLHNTLVDSNPEAAFLLIETIGEATAALVGGTTPAGATRSHGSYAGTRGGNA